MERKTFPLYIKVGIFLFFLAFISYGNTLQLGYFWDDWVVAWNFHSTGAQGVIDSYILDRPIHGYVLGYLMDWVGGTPFRWHFFALLSRGITSWLVWLLLEKTSIGNQLWNTLAAALLLVYPGFTQQAIPLVYVVLIYVAFSAWAVSNILMLEFIRRTGRKSWLLLGLAVFFQLFHLSVSEYFIGLELVRLLFVIFLVTDAEPDIFLRNKYLFIKKIFQNWLPYFIFLTTYLIIRLFIFESGRTTTNAGMIFEQMRLEPLVALGGRLTNFFSDIVDVVLLAWMQPWLLFSKTGMQWGDGLLVMIIVIFVIQIFARAIPNQETIASRYLIFGLSSVIAAGIPIWGIGRQVILDGLGDRYSFPFGFGSVLVLIGLTVSLLQSRKIALWMVTLLLGSSAGFHVMQTRLVYQEDWENQVGFYNQLVLRAPALKDGTSIWLVKDTPILDLEGDYGLALPVNWIYTPEAQARNLPYWVFPVSGESFNRVKLFVAGESPNIQREVRNLQFNGELDNTLVFYYAPPNCLRLIDANRPEFAQSIGISDSVMSLAKIEGILLEGRPPVLPYFLLQPEKSWCHYYQIAELKTYSKDWQGVLNTYLIAERNGFVAPNNSEQMPLLEALIYKRNYARASLIANLVMNEFTPNSRILMCSFIERIRIDFQNDIEGNQFLEELSIQAVCNE